MSNPSLVAAFEAIDHQFQSPLFKELSIHIDEFLKTDRKVSTFNKTCAGKLEKSIQRTTGMNTKFTYHAVEAYVAYVELPVIDRNHPLLVDGFRQIANPERMIKEIERTGSALRGGVDRQKSRVSGVFSEIPFKVGIASGFFNGRFSAGEVASVIIHELGHIFTHFEYLGSNITTNFVLQHISRELTNTREVKRKYEILSESTSALGIELEDTEALVRTQNETVIQTVVLREVLKKRYSELGSDTADMTASEMLADQFTSRHGAGRELITAMDKWERAYRGTAHATTAEYLMAESFKMLLLLVATPLTLLIAPYLAFFVLDPTKDIYDKPKARMERVRRDMVDALKDTSRSADYQKQLVEDIEVVDKILAEIEDRNTFLQAFWIAVWPGTRDNYRQLKFQQDLEMLVNNDVFVKASKIKSLSL